MRGQMSGRGRISDHKDKTLLVGFSEKPRERNRLTLLLIANNRLR